MKHVALKNIRTAYDDRGMGRGIPGKYGFKPVPEEQSFGESVLHVAQINVALLQGPGAQAPAPAMNPVENRSNGRCRRLGTTEWP